MKSLNTIELDYLRAMAQAAELDNLARQMEKHANESFPDLLSGIGDAWKGDNAEEYLKKAGTFPAKMKNSAKDLRSIASTIRTIAKNTRDAEIEAINIANERTY